MHTCNIHGVAMDAMTKIQSVPIKVHKVNFKTKDNAYCQHLNSLNLKEKIYNINKAYKCLDTLETSLSLQMFRKCYYILEMVA